VCRGVSKYRIMTRMSNHRSLSLSRLYLVTVSPLPKFPSHSPYTDLCLCVCVCVCVIRSERIPSSHKWPTLIYDANVTTQPASHKCVSYTAHARVVSWMTVHIYSPFRAWHVQGGIIYLLPWTVKPRKDGVRSCVFCWVSEWVSECSVSFSMLPKIMYFYFAIFCSGFPRLQSRRRTTFVKPNNYLSIYLSIFRPVIPRVGGFTDTSVISYIPVRCSLGTCLIVNNNRSSLISAHQSA